MPDNPAPTTRTSRWAGLSAEVVSIKLLLRSTRRSGCRPHRTCPPGFHHLGRVDRSDRARTSGRCSAAGVGPGPWPIRPGVAYDSDVNVKLPRVSAATLTTNGNG